MSRRKGPLWFWRSIFNFPFCPRELPKRAERLIPSRIPLEMTVSPLTAVRSSSGPGTKIFPSIRSPLRTIFSSRPRSLIVFARDVIRISFTRPARMISNVCFIALSSSAIKRSTLRTDATSALFPRSSSRTSDSARSRENFPARFIFGESRFTKKCLYVSRDTLQSTLDL